MELSKCARMLQTFRRYIEDGSSQASILMQLRIMGLTRKSLDLGHTTSRSAPFARSDIKQCSLIAKRSTSAQSNRSVVPFAASQQSRRDAPAL